MLTMDARLGYTEDVGQLHPNWTEVARSTEDRPLHCSVAKVPYYYLATSHTTSWLSRWCSGSASDS